MKNRKLEILLYSAVGVAVMFGIIVALNLITSVFNTRVDMTAEKLYTLSAGTKAILNKLDTPVEIRYYFSRGETRAPSQFRNYAQQVEDLLREYEQYAKGNIQIKKFDPQPDTADEESAQSDGIEPRPLAGGESFYLGVAISLAPQKVALPFLSPNREKLLEYDLSRALSRVMATSKPVIGLMSSLPVWGMPMNPMMARMGQQQPQKEWVIVSELQRDFDVRRVEMDVDKIDDAIQVLLVIHPKDIKDTAQYAIDQFVMRGGKLIAFLDAMSMVDSQRNTQMPGIMPGGGSNLDKLLKTWGITFDTTKVAADLNFMRRLQMGPGNSQLMPTFLFLNPNGIDTNDVVTSQLDNIWLPFVGAFTGTPADGLTQTALLTTSKESQLVDSMMAQFGGQKMVDEFNPSGKNYALAVRLTGKFKTAFPDGKPETKNDDADKPEEKKTDQPPAATLKETKGDNSVILVGDSDFITDDICVQIDPFFRIATPRNGNLNLAQNMVEQLAGDSNLIGARSRSTIRRSFTVVQELQAQAQKRFQSRINALEDDLKKTQTRVNELQAQKDPNQRLILSQEQQDELVNFREKEAKAKRELKDVRKDLRREIDSLENRLKWVNIAGMPVMVTIAGIGLALLRKQRTKAK